MEEYGIACPRFAGISSAWALLRAMRATDFCYRMLYAIGICKFHWERSRRDPGCEAETMEDDRDGVVVCPGHRATGIPHHLDQRPPGQRDRRGQEAPYSPTLQHPPHQRAHQDAEIVAHGITQQPDRHSGQQLFAVSPSTRDCDCRGRPADIGL